MTCDEIVVTSDEIFIKNSKTTKAVSERVSNLRNKIGNHDRSGDKLADVGLMDDYLRRRIDCLTSHQVKISLPKDNAQKKFGLIEEIDYGLRAAKSIIKFGTVGFSSEENVIEDGTYISSSVYLGIKFGYELSNQLMSIKKAIVFDY